jgi:hypothetical protein
VVTEETVASDMTERSFECGPIVVGLEAELREEDARRVRVPGRGPGGRLPKVQRHIRRLEEPHIIDCGA